VVLIVLCLGLQSGCEDQQPDLDARLGERSATAFLVTGDFQSTGVASALALPSLRLLRNVAAGVAGADPVVRAADGALYIVNRGEGNVTILDGADFTLQAQISTGASSNPQDVAVVGDQLYVPALDSPGVLVLDRRQPDGGVVATIDLSRLDPDGWPDCNSAYAVDGRLFVTCGRLDRQNRFRARGPGVVAVIDTATRQITSVIELEHPNPLGQLRRAPPGSEFAGDLLVSTVSFGEAFPAGCVERVAVAPTPRSAGCAVENEALGGYAAQYDHAPDGTLWLAVTRCVVDCDSRAPVADVMTLRAGSMQRFVAAPEQPIDLAVCPDGHVVVIGRRAGLQVYAPEGGLRTPEPITVSPPPSASGGLVCY
jgi:DNA-binding beta-propeller fold protein YncE